MSNQNFFCDWFGAFQFAPTDSPSKTVLPKNTESLQRVCLPGEKLILRDPSVIFVDGLPSADAPRSVLLYKLATPPRSSDTGAELMERGSPARPTLCSLGCRALFHAYTRGAGHGSA